VVGVRQRERPANGEYQQGFTGFAQVVIEEVAGGDEITTGGDETPRVVGGGEVTRAARRR